jgi:hypothetical protein
VVKADEGLTIRPSPTGAVLCVAWLVFLCLVIVAGAAAEHDPRGLLLMLIWLAWLVPIALIARYRLSVTGDLLTYRRPASTRKWRRDQIAEFGVIQSARRASVGYLYLRTVDGEQVTLYAAAGSRRRPQKIEDWLATLREWLAGTPSAAAHR